MAGTNTGVSYTQSYAHDGHAQLEDKAPQDGAPDYEKKEFFPLKVNHPMIDASSNHP